MGVSTFVGLQEQTEHLSGKVHQICVSCRKICERFASMSQVQCVKFERLT